MDTAPAARYAELSKLYKKSSERHQLMSLTYDIESKIHAEPLKSRYAELRDLEAAMCAANMRLSVYAATAAEISFFFA